MMPEKEILSESCMKTSISVYVKQQRPYKGPLALYTDYYFSGLIFHYLPPTYLGLGRYTFVCALFPQPSPFPTSFPSPLSQLPSSQTYFWTPPLATTPAALPGPSVAPSQPSWCSKAAAIPDVLCSSMFILSTATSLALRPVSGNRLGDQSMLNLIYTL